MLDLRWVFRPIETRGDASRLPGAFGGGLPTRQRHRELETDGAWIERVRGAVTQTRQVHGQERPEGSRSPSNPAHSSPASHIKTVEWKSPERLLSVGARIAFTAAFMGRQLAYIYEITDFVPGERLVMTTADGPFPMETTYTWQETETGGTKMTLRNRGEPAGFSKLTAPVLAAAMSRANRNDLKRLKAILETKPASFG
jgi:Polyketide cyclase / dehydrase and lipid transport